MLFCVVNVCRYLKIDPETAFKARTRNSSAVSATSSSACASRAAAPSEATLEEMDKLWDEGKKRDSEIRPVRNKCAIAVLPTSSGFIHAVPPTVSPTLGAIQPGPGRTKMRKARGLLVLVGCARCDGRRTGGAAALVEFAAQPLSDEYDYAP